jgi:hypothetical protein
MRKPVSKHALRRALEQARDEGMLAWDAPTGAVVDNVWHQIAREALDGKPRTGQARAAEGRRKAPAPAAV